MRLFFVAFLISNICCENLFSQMSDSLPKNKDFKIIPLSLMGAGTIMSFTASKEFKRYKQIPFVADNFHYSTFFLGSLAPIFKIDSKHSFNERTLLFSSSLILSSAVAISLKKITNIQRPDASNLNSFPSGHSTTAFATAQWIREEYKDSNQLLSLSGYFVAVASSVLRVIYHKHWPGDVVFGAGLGIISTKIIYNIFPNGFRNKNFKLLISGPENTAGGGFVFLF